MFVCFGYEMYFYKKKKLIKELIGFWLSDVTVWSSVKSLLNTENNLSSASGGNNR